MRFVPKVPSTGSPTLNTISGLGLKDHGSIPIDVNAGDKACVQTTLRGTSQRALKPSKVCIASLCFIQKLEGQKHIFQDVNQEETRRNQFSFVALVPLHLSEVCRLQDPPSARCHSGRGSGWEDLCRHRQ